MKKSTELSRIKFLQVISASATIIVFILLLPERAFLHRNVDKADGDLMMNV